MSNNAEVLANAAAKALDDKKGEDIRVYDVRGISAITDFTVAATGTSAPHLRGLIAEVQRQLREQGYQSYRMSGDPASGWVIIDYVDVVIHVFSPEAREYYAIERLWEKPSAEPKTEE